MATSKEITDQLKQSLRAMVGCSVDPNDYEGPLGEVVCDIITADSAVAGVATRMLDSEEVESLERAFRIFIATPLMTGNVWLHKGLYGGPEFDLSGFPQILDFAQVVERTRELVSIALSAKDAAIKRCL